MKTHHQAKYWKIRRNHWDQYYSLCLFCLLLEILGLPTSPNKYQSLKVLKILQAYAQWGFNSGGVLTQYLMIPTLIRVCQKIVISLTSIQSFLPVNFSITKVFQLITCIVNDRSRCVSFVQSASSWLVSTFRDVEKLIIYVQDAHFLKTVQYFGGGPLYFGKPLLDTEAYENQYSVCVW